MTRTGKVPKLMRSEHEPFLEMHPDDAGDLGVSDKQLVRVTSRRGSLEVRARVTDAIRSGAVFAPFHWGELFNRHAVTNNATSEAIDARSKQPELKFAAVRVEPAQHVSAIEAAQRASAIEAAQRASAIEAAQRASAIEAAQRVSVIEAPSA